MSETRNVLAMTKGEEQFVFIYDDDGVEKLLDTLARFAEDDDINFSWYDAAILSRKAIPDGTEADFLPKGNRLPKAS